MLGRRPKDFSSPFFTIGRLLTSISKASDVTDIEIIYVYNYCYYKMVFYFQEILPYEVRFPDIFVLIYFSCDEYFPIVIMMVLRTTIRLKLKTPLQCGCYLSQHDGSILFGCFCCSRSKVSSCSLQVWISSIV